MSPHGPTSSGEGKTAAQAGALPPAYAWIQEEIGRLEALHLRRFRRVRSGEQGPVLVLDGREVVNFGSNDYRGLAQHPAVIEAAKSATQHYGWGSGASAVVCGYTALHRRLEEALAHFHASEAAVVFGSGYAANVGVVSSLVGPGDVVYMDQANHASLWDGCRLSRADIRLFDHRDVGSLREQLKKRHRYRRALIITDSVFSIEGDLAPLADLAELARSYDAMLLVDEAHAIGVFGPCGQGVVAELGLEGAFPVRIGTLSKAIGSVGGYVVAPMAAAEWIVSKARSYLFSTAMPPAAAAAALKALSLLEQSPAEGYSLRQRAEDFRRKVEELGWNVGRSQSQIVPITVGTPDKALQLSAQLFHRGLFCPAMRPPTVPEGRSCIRVSLTTLHTEAMIDRLLSALAELRDIIRPQA